MGYEEKRKETQDLIYDLEDMSLELVQDYDVKVDIIPYVFNGPEVVKFMIPIEYKKGMDDKYISFIESVYSISKINRYKVFALFRLKDNSWSKKVITSKSFDSLFKNVPELVRDVDYNFKLELVKYNKVRKGSIVKKRKALNDIFNNDDLGLLENTKMKYLKGFNENFNKKVDVEDDILDIFLPFKDISEGTLDLTYGTGDKSNHLSVEVVSEDTVSGFTEKELKELKVVLKHFENYCNDNNIKIVDENDNDYSYFELVGKEIMCPQCGSHDIDSSGYDYDRGESNSECRDCEYVDSDDEFENSHVDFNDFDKLNNSLNNHKLIAFIIIVKI